MNIFRISCLITALTFSGLCVAQLNPELVFGSFLGGTGDEIAFRNTLDKSADGLLGFVGSTSSTFMLSTQDAYQSQLQGSLNRFIVILDSDGQSIYRSYFGGGAESGGGFAFTPDNGFVIGGNSTSASFPTTPGAYQVEFLQNDPGQGSRMGTLSKFDPDYQLEWSTYLGGHGQDAINDVVTDAFGNIYVSGATFNEGLATTGAHQESLNVLGQWAPFIAKFGPSGQLLYLTYFQGNGFTDIGKIQLSNQENSLFVCGSTSAESGIAMGGIQDVYAGGATDGFLARFSTEDLSLEWSRYIGGDQTDGAHTMDVGDDDQIAIVLYTTSLSGLATPGAHSEVPAIDSGDILDGPNLMLMSLSGQGEINWATYYGASPPVAQNTSISILESAVLIGGPSNMDSGIATENAMEDELNPGNGRFFAKFGLAEGNLEWGTYFGMNGQAFFYDIAYIDDGRFMAIGTAGTPNDYITSGAFQSVFGGGLSDFYYAIFEENTLSSGHHMDEGFLQLFPNPASQWLRVIAPDQPGRSQVIEIYDMSGRLLLQELSYTGGSALSIGHLPSGLYLVQLKDGERQYRQRLLISH